MALAEQEDKRIESDLHVSFKLFKRERVAQVVA